MKLLTVADVAEILALGEETVRRWAADGRLPAYKLTGQKALRFKEQEILDLIDSRKVEPKKEQG